MKKMVLLLMFGAGILHAQILGTNIPISTDPGQQGWIQVGYNCVDDEYLVVWEDYRFSTTQAFNADIYGQRLDGEGRPIGGNFPVCNTTAQQFWPHLDFDPVSSRYLVVFEDYRNGNNADVYACLLDEEGQKIWTDSCETDTSFALTKNPESVYAPSVAYNSQTGTFLAVWGGLPGQLPNSGTAIYGEMVTSAGVRYPADVTQNLVIAQDFSSHEVSNPDVTYHPATNEWFVVYGFHSDDLSYVYGQRVAADGSMVKPDGTPGLEGTCISTPSLNGADSMQPRVQSNSETFPSIALSAWNKTYTECLVTWNKQPTSGDWVLDIHAQRMAFISDAAAVALGYKAPPAVAGRFVTVYVDSSGHSNTALPTNFVISGNPSNQRNTELAFSQLDQEYLVAWGDLRSQSTNQSDMYGQRISIKPDSGIVFLDANRQPETFPINNIPLVTTADFEGNWNINGCAHNSHRNEFLAAYVFTTNSNKNDSCDVKGVRLGGTIPSAVEEIVQQPSAFELYPNFPNPFNAGTELRYRLSENAVVSMRIYDLLGREVIALMQNVPKGPGLHRVTWNGRDADGMDAHSGVYVVRLTTSRYETGIKIVLAK